MEFQKRLPYFLIPALAVLALIMVLPHQPARAADEIVNVTSTVDQALTFDASDNTVGYGSLASANARWATGDLLGTGTQPTLGIGAHELTVSTNATDGYTVKYNGATLTSGADTIDVATITNDGNGTPGTEQFAIAASTTGDATIVADYQYSADPTTEYKFVASTLTQIFSETGPSATETVDLYYIGNIAALTEAGTYASDITYTATGVY